MKQLFFTFLIIFSSLGLTAQETTWPYPFSHNGVWGIVDENRQELVAPQFEKIELFWHARSPEEGAVASKGDMVGFINRNGTWLIAPKMDSITFGGVNSEFLYRVQKKKRWGAISLKSDKAKWVVKPKFNSMNLFLGRETLLSVVTNKKGQGVVNQEGEFVVPCKYNDISITYSYMDHPIIELSEENGETIHMDAQGNQLSEEELEEIVGDEMDVAFEDATLEDMAPSMAPSVSFSEGKNGETIINFRADYHKESVIVPVGYKVEKVVTTNDFIPKIKYISLSKGNKFGLLNAQGQIITPVEYNRIEWKEGQNYALLYIDDKIGLANYWGIQVLPAAFSDISRHNHWLFKVVHPDGYEGYGNSQGKVFLPDYIDLGE